MASRRLRQQTHLILDYDGTITVKDTMAVLGELPKAPKMTWKQITDAYMEDYAAYKKQPYPWKNYDRKEYSAWLASLKCVEDRSARRVQDACLFRGITHQEVNDAVTRSIQNGKLEIRDGWEMLIQLFLPDYDPTDRMSSPNQVSILSVNWSETAIRRALWQAAAGSSAHPEMDTLCHLINDMVIHANEIEGLGSPLGSSGRVCSPLGQDIRTSDDKLRYLRAALGPQGDDKCFVVYVGDSSTDFDSLCAADLGIWICPVPEAQYAQAFAKAFKPLNFVPPPLTSFDHGAGEHALFYWAPDFYAVHEALTVESE